MKKKDILFILASGFFLVLAWIGFNIYHNSKTSTIPEATNIQIAPITPSFDQKTIEEIKTRRNIQAIFEGKSTPTPTATNSATPTTSPTPEITGAIQNPVTPTGIQP